MSLKTTGRKFIGFSATLAKRCGWLMAIIILSLQVPTLILRAQESAAEAPVFIRDAEIENYLYSLAKPIWAAADIDPHSVHINIVESNTINAFVADGMNEFFYTGLLQLTDTPEQLAGVIAHETGHIAGGHLIRGREEMANASAEAILGMLLAVAAGAASGNGQVAAAGMSGSQNLVERSFLSFSRTQEASADAAGMSFLDKSSITAQGMLEFFSKLQDQEGLPTDRQDAYVRTHPLTGDRIDAVRHHVENSSTKNDKLPAKFAEMHARMKAKLMGYIQPETALLRYTDNDKRLTARYARAIALYRTSQADKALVLTDALIRQEPQNPFFYELKGQVQFDNGRIAEAVVNYKKANDLLPNSALLHQEYGHALLENKDPASLDIAIQQLLESDRLEDRQPSTWHFLAAAWGRKSEVTKDPELQAMATYALAEEAFAQGRNKPAGTLADRAMKGLRKGSSYWLRAQDIKLSTSPEDDTKKKDR